MKRNCNTLTAYNFISLSTLDISSGFDDDTGALVGLPAPEPPVEELDRLGLGDDTFPNGSFR